MEESFISQEFSSGESEKEEDMVNYIDHRKAYIPFNKLSREDQIDRCFFMWQILVKKLRGSVYLIQAFALLHKSMYVKGTTKKNRLEDNKEDYFDIEQKRYWFIIMPHWTFKKIWSAVI